MPTITFHEETRTQSLERADGSIELSTVPDETYKAHCTECGVYIPGDVLLSRGAKTEVCDKCLGWEDLPF